MEIKVIVEAKEDKNIMVRLTMCTRGKLNI